MTRQQILDALHRGGLSQYANSFEQLLRSAIALKTITTNESELPVGATKFGGSPDLLPGMTWPEQNGKPLSFLAQIRLRDVASLDYAGALPASGLLLFFYDALEEPWGYDPADRGGGQVLFIESGLEVLTRTPAPPFLEEAIFQPCRAEASPTITVPGWSSESLDAVFGKQDKDRLFDELYEGQINSYDAEGAAHQLLGHEYQIQGEMNAQCQMASNGVYCGDEKYLSGPRWEELGEGRKDWRLLLQIDSDDNTDWMWGDNGMLYFWIREQDLAARRFDKVWTILQCY